MHSEQRNATLRDLELLVIQDYSNWETNLVPSNGKLLDLLLLDYDLHERLLAICDGERIQSFVQEVLTPWLNRCEQMVDVNLIAKFETILISVQRFPLGTFQKQQVLHILKVATSNFTTLAQSLKNKTLDT